MCTGAPCSYSQRVQAMPFTLHSHAVDDGVLVQALERHLIGEHLPQHQPVAVHVARRRAAEPDYRIYLTICPALP
jgi:hypothetical protein